MISSGDDQDHRLPARRPAVRLRHSPPVRGGGPDDLGLGRAVIDGSPSSSVGSSSVAVSPASIGHLGSFLSFATGGS